MRKYLSTLLALALCAPAAKAQVVLSLDFNDRSNDTPANLESGFNSFVIGSIVSSTAIQTNATTRNYGAISVTLSGNGANPGYDDRLRTVPSNSVAFTQERLLKDVVFSPDTTTNGGLNITVTGLASHEFYHITIWSFDNSSTGARVSDWFVNGVQLIDNYTFNGSNLPTNNSQYQFTMSAQASATGDFLIQGRRDATTSSAGGVFLNALQLEIAPPDPPFITTNPASVDLYQGDNTSFTVKAGGTLPLLYQWFYNQTNLIAGATNATFLINNAQLIDAGLFHAVVSNLSGYYATSAPAALVVRPIMSVTSGLLAYWPLDTITDSTPDVSGNIYNLWATNMDVANLTTGQIGNSLSFNGTDEFLMRTNAPGELLPAYAYPAYSVTLWVKGNFVGQNDRRVFAESWNLNNSPLMTIGTDSASNAPVVDIFIRNNNGTTPINHRKSSLFAFDNIWHHIAWVDNNGSAQLYVDGVQDTNNFNYTRGVLTPNIETLGGLYRTNAQALFTGEIDDVAVWRRSLTSNEVQYVMVNGAGDPNLPVVTVQPVNQTVSCSGTAIFSVGASGAAPLSYQWHDICGDIPGATGATLVLSNVTLADAGNYFVTISNEFGVVTSDDARLAVNASVSPVLPRLHIAKGANAEISWPVAAANFVLQETPSLNSPISWTAAGQTAVTNGTNLSVSVPFGAGNKFYRLISTNSTPLCLPSPLSIVATPAGRAVNIPSTVGLSVTATGVGPLTYQWKLNGTTLPDKTNSSLSVSVTNLTNLGAYSVTVQDSSSSAYSSPAVIRLAGLETKLADDFANRPLITNAAGSIHGTTFGATREIDEPVHAGIPGGKSVWLTWQAPATGIATFDTIGSGFDTLLAVYTGTDFSSFGAQASDDDSGGFLCSRVIFNVNAGANYEVALDGLADASGFFNLNWNLVATAEKVPVITSQPLDAVVGSNQTATFSVDTAPGVTVTYQWQFEGSNIFGATNSTLLRTNAQFSMIGDYAVVVSDGARSTISRIASLQLATNPTNFHFVPKAVLNFTCPPFSVNPFAPLGSRTKQPRGIVAGTAGTISAKIGSLNNSTLAICKKRSFEMYMTNLMITCTSGNASTVALKFKGDNSSTTLEVYDASNPYSLVVLRCVENSTTSPMSLTFPAVSGGNYFVIVSAAQKSTIVTVDYDVPNCTP